MEGQSPATLNDSARGMMAALSKKRDDDGGLLVTTGTGTAYLLASNQNLAAAAVPGNVNGFKITFQPNVTNGAAATLSVDGQTAQPLYVNGSAALPANFFQPNGIYTAVYEASIPAWIVHNIPASSLLQSSTASGGTANAQTVVAPGFVLAAGNAIIFNPGFANTGALTINVNGTGVKNVYIQSASGPIVCVGAELVLNQYAICIYDGTQFELINPAPRAGFGPQTSLASAATADLGTIFSHNVNITGTTGITAFGSSANVASPVYLLTFAASLLLTYNASSLILPGKANIQTQAGDYCKAIYLGSGNCQVIDYVRAAIPFVMAMPGVQGLVINNDGTTPNSNIDVACTSAILTVGGIAGQAYNIGSQSLVVNLGTTGANALDTGTVAASIWYFVYIIYNPSTGTVAGLASLSSTAPTLPAGYTHYYRVGAMLTDGSSNLRRTLQLGKRAVYTASLSNISTTATVTASTYFPPTASVWKMYLINAGSSGVSLGDSNGVLYGASAGAIGREIDFNIDMLAAGTTFAYTVSAGASGLTMVGWEDKVNAA